MKKKLYEIGLIICIFLIACVLLVASYFAVRSNAAEPVKTASESEINYYDYADSLDLFEVYDSPDLTMETLAARNGKLIIERAVGIVEDAETGAGHVIGYPEFYISYKRVNGISNGNVICTYFVYNPETNHEDDILMRFDYIIDTGEVE